MRFGRTAPGRRLEAMSYTYGPQPAWRPAPMRAGAPVSLHLVAIAQYLGGVLMLALAAMLGLAAANVFPRLELAVGASTWTNRPADVTPVVAVVCAVVALIGLTAIVLGRKVQRGRNWARIVLIVLNVLSAASAVWQAYMLADWSAPTLVAIAVPVLFVVLLNTRAARAWCR
jgi:hypothetical protein